MRNFLVVLSNQTAKLRVVPRCIPIITVVNHPIVARMPITRHRLFTFYARSHVLIVIKIENIWTDKLVSDNTTQLSHLYCTELNQGPLPSATPRIKFRVRFASLNDFARSVLVDSLSSIWRKRNTNGIPSSGRS